MRELTFIVILNFYFIDLSSQDHKNEVHTIAFYNLENLFDTINDVTINDEASPIMETSMNKTSVYHNKLKNLSKVISEIGFAETGSFPTIIGICEVENRLVVEDLINTGKLKGINYNISHFDSPDNRGIDVGLIYNQDYFKIVREKNIALEIFDFDNGKQIFTRDQLLVEGLLSGERIFIIINHWPSRYGGAERSKPYRNKAAELNRFIIDSINVVDQNAKIFTIGDFNDDPTDESIKKILKTVKEKNKLLSSEMYNPYEKMFDDGYGTLKYRGLWNMFDQIILSKYSLKDYNKINFYFDGAYIHTESYLINQDGNYKGYPFRSFAGGNFIGGYSDHLPVYIILKREQ
jgi:hypothetical protein